MPRGMFHFRGSAALFRLCCNGFVAIRRGWLIGPYRRRALPASRLGPLAGVFALGLHEPRAERPLGRVLVVPPAAEADVLDRRFAAAREFPDVIELDPRSRLTAMPGLAHERALAAVALPHGALHVGRDVADARGALPACPRLRCRAELALL